MKNTVWILTRSHNEYNQYGEYFVRSYHEKPTREKLLMVEGITENQEHDREGNVDDILEGKGRVNYSEVWYHLKEVECY